MDVSRMKNDKKLYLCRRYFLGGFALLPFLWAVNSVWFFKDAFRKPHFTEQTEIRKYVIRSMIGSTIWLAGLITWIVVFQINRAEWGAVGDDISMVIPKGRA